MGFRMFTDWLATALSTLAALLVIAPLIAIFAYLMAKGFGSIDLAFFTEIPKPVGEPGGGMANAIVGTGIILGIAALIGVPIGVGAGIFLSEYSDNPLSTYVRFTSDVLNGVPSIVVGLAAYGLIV